MQSQYYMYTTIPNAGPGKEIYTVGAGGQKGQEGSEEKLYCQVIVICKDSVNIVYTLTAAVTHSLSADNIHS